MDAWKLPEPITLAQFDLGETLGTGSFGRVRFVTHKSTGTHWALKIAKKADIVRLQQVDHIISEKNILLSLHHPFIVSLSGTFQDGKFLYIVLEYVVGGELTTYLRKRECFDNNTAKFYGAQVVTMLEYLHAQDIVYRDLKPENLLLDQTGYLKLIDFGLAKRIEFKTFTLCGTPEYMAPELLLNRGHGKGVDWWSLGVLLYEMLAGQPPFVGDNPMAIYQQVITSPGNILFPRICLRNAKKIIRQLLTPDLTKRYGCMHEGAEGVKAHKWFQGITWELLINRKNTPPKIPRVTSTTDTSNFDTYPDSIEEAGVPQIEEGQDPFVGF